MLLKNNRIKYNQRWIYILIFSSIHILLLLYLAIRIKNTIVIGRSEILYYGNNILLIIELLLFILIVIGASLFKSINKINSIILIWLIYSICFNITTQPILSFISIVIESLFWPSLFILYYIIAKKRIMSYKIIISIVIMMLTAVCYLYLQNYNIANFNIAETGIYSGINNIYYILLFVPWIMIIDNQIYKNTILVIIFIMVAISMKRTALIALSISFLVYYFREIKYAGVTRKITITFIATCVVLGLYYIINHYLYMASAYFGNRFTKVFQGNGGGREAIWAQSIDIILSANIMKVLFGHGHNMVQELNGLRMTAHNDYIEILIDYGMVGIIIYITFIIIVINQMINMKQLSEKYQTAGIVSIVLFVIISLFSHLYLNPSYMYVLASFWGYTIGYKETITKIKSIKWKEYYI